MLLFHFKTLGSTHRWLQQHFFEIVDGASNTSIPCAGVTADKQTEAMEGVEWLSFPGNLCCSLLIPISEHISRKDWGLFSLIGASSLCTTLKGLTGLETTAEEIWTSWPGSVKSKKGKLGALLVDTMENPLENRWFALLSFSVNLNHSLATGCSKETISETCILEKLNERHISTEKCFLALYKQISKDFKLLFSGKVTPLLSSIRKWVNQEPCIRFKYEDEFFSGKLLDILDDGSGVVELSDGKQAIFHAGSVSKLECLNLSKEESIVEHYSRA
ncbi:hypothetical protein [Candidatus Similichlamydia laticola]|uniref:Uncharacterized protein n=1 Tax=Candidatus Similichlamydia laticola TaxID=2170265 RepID=A0A369KC12_9BACT|nr:hypothetical protein [Candidatus Similichlamydia laticola]RDB31132.1 hypothetical protein HAT2_00766 [Candidatus Similichlamydia laticola]